MPSVEGTLKVTRSLGDSPFHKDGAVSAEPAVAHVPLTSTTRFGVIASDGIWDHMSNEEVVAVCADAIRAVRPDALGGTEPPPLSKQRSNQIASMAAAAACEAVLDRIEHGQKSGEYGSGVDDRSVAVVIFGHEQAQRA